MVPILMLFLVVAGGLFAAPEIAELAIVNANIYTVNPKQPKAKAMAVRGGRVIAVGDSVAEHVGPRTRVIDLAGATVIPGLIDSHVHMANFGFMVETFDLRSVNSIADVGGGASALGNYLSRHSQRWLRGARWRHGLLQLNKPAAFPAWDLVAAMAALEQLPGAQYNQARQLTDFDVDAAWHVIENLLSEPVR